MPRNEDNINLNLIIAGCQRSNRKSQQVLFEHFFGYGMNISLRYAKNREEAEEILNNAFLKVFRYIDRYDATYPFRIWLRRIVINAAIDYHRAHQNRLTMVELEDAPEPTTDAFPLPEINTTNDMLPIVQRLPTAYRMVFNLYVMEEYNHNEIAELLGISAKTSRSNLARAKAKLRAWLSTPKSAKRRNI